MTPTLAAMTVAALLAVAGHASAQARHPVTVPKYELDAGGGWIGGTSYGSADANLTTGAGGTQLLFSTSSERAPGLSLESSLAVRMALHVRAEVTASWQRADLRTTTSADFEGAAPLTLTLPVSTFAVEGAALYEFHPRRQFDPFVRGGVGWSRDLTENAVLAKDGVIANVGAGVKYWWSPRVGLRSEVRAVIRSGGLELADSSTRVSPAVTGSVAFRF